jgi:hypothetical protein
MFWLPFGTAASVIGLAVMTIGVTRTSANANLLSNVWFDGGLGLLAVGAALLLWSLFLFLSRRRDAARLTAPDTQTDPKKAKDEASLEAVRGYFKERERLFQMWQKEKDRKDRR